ncbi:hypothetical protein [Aminobacter sp. LjRoot7]|uniref:hypothetical protein n=1 Tax=Aminobacter sp. LjRoot7 TaxID=3342335 RepID=UPI003ED12A95
MGSDEAPAWAGILREWRQGDYTVEIDHILLANGRGEDGFLEPVAGTAIGLVVISQTCDVVNYGNSDKEWVTVAALIKIDEAQLTNVQRGRAPTWTTLERPPAENVVVNLNQIMTIHKSVLAKVRREVGFDTDATRIRFADALARKHGRFAFPDVFSEQVLSDLRKRVTEAHKKDSDQGKAYRSIFSTRVSGAPNWDNAEVTVGFRFVLVPEAELQIERSKISEVVGTHLQKIKWPEGFKPENPPFVLQTEDEMSAKEWLESQEVDWGFISWPSGG